MILETIFFLLLAHLILGIYLYWRIKDFYKYPNNFGLPIIGNLYCFYKGLWSSSIDDAFCYMFAALEKNGGDMCFTLIQGRLSVLMACPHITEKISYNPNLADKPYEAYGGLNGLIRGVFSYCPTDQEWKLRRKEMNSCLTKSKIEGPYTEQFINVGNYLTENMAKKPNSVDIIYHSVFASINSVTGSLFGIKKFSAPDKRFYKTLLLLLEYGSRGITNPVVGFIFFNLVSIFESIFLSATSSIKNQISGNLRSITREVEPENDKDVSKLPLSAIIALRHKKLNLPMKEMRKELYELLLAGAHTFSVGLYSSIAFLGMFPDIQEKAWLEQYEIFGDDTREPTLEDVKKMVYLDRFYKESLRIFSPPLIAKKTSGDVNIGGATVPAGCLVYFLLFKMRTDPRYWKDPEKFNPDRFPDAERNLPKYSNPAFGIGVRSCPGMSFAKHQGKIVLSKVLRRFKIYSDQKYEDLKLAKQIMVEPVNLKRLRIEERK